MPRVCVPSTRQDDASNTWYDNNGTNFKASAAASARLVSTPYAHSRSGPFSAARLHLTTASAAHAHAHAHAPVHAQVQLRAEAVEPTVPLDQLPKDLCDKCGPGLSPLLVLVLLC